MERSGPATSGESRYMHMRSAWDRLWALGDCAGVSRLGGLGALSAGCAGREGRADVHLHGKCEAGARVAYEKDNNCDVECERAARRRKFRPNHTQLAALALGIQGLNPFGIMVL